MRRWLASSGLVWALISIGCGGNSDGESKGDALSFGQSGADTKGGAQSVSSSNAGNRSSTAAGGGVGAAASGSQGGFRSTSVTGGVGATNATGGSRSATVTGGVGATNATGGGKATAGDSSAEDLLHGVDPNTQYGACASYIIMQTLRRAECEKGPINVSNLALGLDLCPDAFFSKGSNVSVEQVLACAEKWRTHPCEQYNRMVYPECDLPEGDFALGEACAFPRQCQSTACAGTEGSSCKQCVEFGGVGAKCHQASPPIACAYGLECTGSGCRIPPVFNLPAGSRCERLGQCEFGYLCLADPTDGLERCLGPRAEGDSCADVQFCASGLYCDSVTLTCTRRPGENEACAAGSICAGSLYCNANARCERRHAAGQACTPVTTYTDVVSDCQAGLECICSDDSCAVGVCYERRMPTEACDDGVGKCGKGLRCSEGVCVESGLIGLFEATCGG